jgi:hypothetical protein
MFDSRNCAGCEADLNDVAAMSPAVSAFVVLAKWYAARSAVRRLWAIRESQRMRVIVTLEPTHDGDDIYPAWLANGHEWAHELQLRMDVPVQLEVVDDPFLAELAAGVDGVLVAALFWRDSSMPPDYPPDDVECGKSRAEIVDYLKTLK